MSIVSKIEGVGFKVLLHGAKYGEGRPVCGTLSFHCEHHTTSVEAHREGDGGEGYVVVSARHKGGTLNQFLSPAQAVRLRKELSKVLQLEDLANADKVASAALDTESAALAH